MHWHIWKVSSRLTFLWWNKEFSFESNFKEFLGHDTWSLSVKIQSNVFISNKREWVSVSLSFFYCLACEFRHSSFEDVLDFVFDLVSDSAFEEDFKPAGHGGPNVAIKVDMDV